MASERNPQRAFARGKRKKNVIRETRRRPDMTKKGFAIDRRRIKQS